MIASETILRERERGSSTGQLLHLESTKCSVNWSVIAKVTVRSTPPNSMQENTEQISFLLFPLAKCGGTIAAHNLHTAFRISHYPVEEGGSFTLTFQIIWF